MTTMSRKYNDESRAEYDRIFRHGRLNHIIELLEIRDTCDMGKIIDVDVRDIVDVEDASTFGCLGRVLIKFSDKFMYVSGDHLKIAELVSDTLKSLGEAENERET